jgi:hypothetical protein
MSWFPLSVLAGLLMGVGMILARNALAVLPSYIFVGILGVVWAMGSGSLVFSKGQTNELMKAIVLIAILAGFFFWLENIFRFRALPKAPLSAYVLLTIEVIGVSMTIIYDLFKLHRAGKLSSISTYEVLGLVTAGIAFTFFALAPKRESINVNN